MFTIHFRDRANRDAFFANPEYQAMKRRYFEASVRSTAILAEYERP